MPERISELVYLDTAPLPDGTALIETYPPEARSHIERQVEESGEGWKWAHAAAGRAGQHVQPGRSRRRSSEAAGSRAVAQPFGTYTQPLRLGNSCPRRVAETGDLVQFSLIRCEMIASDHPLFRELDGPEWRFNELPTVTGAMFSRPDDLAELLIDIVASEAAISQGLAAQLPRIPIPRTPVNKERLGTSVLSGEGLAHYSFRNNYQRRPDRQELLVGRLIINNAITVNGAFEAPVPEPEGVAVSTPTASRPRSRSGRQPTRWCLAARPTKALAAVWPQMADLPGFEAYAEQMNSMPKYVASRTLSGPLEWNATLLEGDLAESVSSLKDEHHGNLVVSGAGELARELMAHGLVDEIWFTVSPYLWATGPRIFDDVGAVRLELVSTTTFPSGVVRLCYRPAPAETPSTG